MKSEPERAPLPIGTKVKPYGEIAAVCLTGGERYYMLVDKHGCVALMPSEVIEEHHDRP